MIKIAYQARTGATPYRPVLSYHEYLHTDDTGFCLHCGDYTERGTEPDARRYACEGCEQPKVYGLQELFLMGLVTLTDHRGPPLTGVSAGDQIGASAFRR